MVKHFGLDYTGCAKPVRTIEDHDRAFFERIRHTGSRPTLMANMDTKFTRKGVVDANRTDSE